MSVQINSDTHINSGLYCNGCLVTYPGPGREFHSNPLRISLIGVSRTCIITGEGLEREVHQSCETFLNIQREPYGGPEVLEHGRATLFWIQVPHDPASKRSGVFNPPWSYEEPKPQALPPSGEFGSGNTVTYSVEVLLVDENSRQHIKSSKPLTFSMTREIEAPDPEIITTISEQGLVSPGQSTFKLALDGPRIIVPEQALPLNIRIVYGEAHITEFSRPTVLLRSGLLQLLENTFIQSEDNTNDQWTNKHTISSVPQFGSNAEAPSITTQGLDLGLLLQNPRISQHFPPSFASPNIQRTYGLLLSLIVECGGDTFELAFGIDPVTLLGAEHIDAPRRRQEEAASLYP